MCVDLGLLGSRLSPYGTNASKILVFIQSRENAPTAQLQHQMVTPVQGVAMWQMVTVQQCREGRSMVLVQQY